MKLYNGMSPNGARVFVFLQEKGIDIPVEMIDILGGGTRTDAFRKINSLAQVPVLELDDGSHLAESVAICRYLEGLYPEPALFGQSDKEKAFVDMWCRRIELWLFNVAGDVGLHEIPFFAKAVNQNADYAADRRAVYLNRLKWLNEELSDGRTYLVNDRFSMADIIGMGMLLVAGYVNMHVPEGLRNVRRWEAALKARPSFPKMPGETDGA